MQLLRPNDVARTLNCSVSQVYALKDAGMIRFLKIGGMIRFRPEDIEAFLSSCVVERTPESRKAPAKSGGRFTHLDGERLLAAWQQRGARTAQLGERSAPTSE